MLHGRDEFYETVNGWGFDYGNTNVTEFAVEYWVRYWRRIAERILREQAR